MKKSPPLFYQILASIQVTCPARLSLEITSLEDCINGLFNTASILNKKYEGFKFMERPLS
jgi:hypothetical protein